MFRYMRLVGEPVEDTFNYLVDDITLYASALWVCIQSYPASEDHSPPDPSYWNLLVPAGERGPQGEQGAKGDTGDQFLANRWTNATRPVDPGADLVGYNEEEQRPEVWVEANGLWYYLWQGEVEAEPPTGPAIFSDNFESGWLLPGAFTQLFIDLFESGWFIDHPFSSIFVENFEGAW